MMKSISTKGLAVLAMGIFFGLGVSASAHEEGMNMQMGEGRGWDKGGWDEGCQKSCGLSDSQAKQCKDLFKKQREETQTQCDQMKVDMDTLKLKVDAKAGDDEIKDLLAKIETQKDKLKTIRDGYMVKFKATLTPTQQAKFLMAKMECDKMCMSMGMGMGKDCSMGKMGKGKDKGELKKDHDGDKDAKDQDTK